MTAVDLIVAGLLTISAPTPTHGLVLSAAIVFGVVSALAGLTVADRCRHSILGALVVLQGMLAAVFLTLALAEDTLSEPPGADYLTVAMQGAWVLIYVVIALPLLF